MMHMTAAITKQRAQFRVLLHNGIHKRRAGQAANVPIRSNSPLGTKSSDRAPSSLSEMHCSTSCTRSSYGRGLSTCCENQAKPHEAFSISRAL